MTTQPEIPADIINAAWELVRKIGIAPTEYTMHVVATALLAQRNQNYEECAGIARKMADDWIGENGGAACEAVAAAILQLK
jgi:hypothetical protein